MVFPDFPLSEWISSPQNLFSVELISSVKIPKTCGSWTILHPSDDPTKSNSVRGCVIERGSSAFKLVYQRHPGVWYVRYMRAWYVRQQNVRPIALSPRNLLLQIVNLLAPTRARYATVSFNSIYNFSDINHFCQFFDDFVSFFAWIYLYSWFIMMLILTTVAANDNDVNNTYSDADADYTWEWWIWCWHLCCKWYWW